MVDATYDEIEAQAVRLSAVEKARLMEKLASSLKEELTRVEKRPLDTLHGILADYNLDISEFRLSSMHS